MSKKVTDLVAKNILDDNDLFFLVDLQESDVRNQNKKTSLKKIKDNILAGSRQVLTEDTTYFVDPVVGSDNNSGLSPELAFKTLNKVFDLIQKNIDAAGFQITIILAQGEYINLENTVGRDTSLPGQYGFFHIPQVLSHDNNSCAGVEQLIPNAPLIIKGQGANTIINGLDLDHEMYVNLEDLNLRSSLHPDFSGSGLSVSRQGTIALFNVTFSMLVEDSLGAISAKEGGTVVISTDIEFIGDFNTVFYAATGGLICGAVDGSNKIVFRDDTTINNFAFAEVSGDINLSRSLIQIKESRGNLRNYTAQDTQLKKVVIKDGSIYVKPSYFAFITDINKAESGLVGGIFSTNTLNKATFVTGTPNITPPPSNGTIVIDDTLGSEKLFVRVNNTWKSIALS